MRAYPGFSLIVLGVALGVACSDDGLVNQSSGQAASSTSGMSANDGPELTTGPVPGTTAEPESTASAPGDSTAAVSDGPAPDTSTSGSSGPELTSDTGTTGTGTDTGTTGGNPSQECIDGCVVEFMCGTKWLSEADCVAACEANLVVAGGFSPFCRAAWEALSTCLATLTCEEFAQWESPMMFPYPCSDADTSLSIECEGQ